MNTNKDWKMVPVESTDEIEQAAADYLDVCIKAAGLWDAMLSAAPEAPPLTVTVDPDARGVSVGVYQGSRCVHNGAHPIPAGSASERDWELTCEGCDGDGFVYVERRVGMCATDVQTFKEECECCEGRGFTLAFEDIPGIGEYVKSCRAASTVATEGEKDERQDWMACESRRPWVTNSLKTFADDLRDKERRCRTAYNKDFFGIPTRYVADAYAEAAAVFEAKLAAIAQQSQRKEA